MGFFRETKRKEIDVAYYNSEITFMIMSENRHKLNFEISEFIKQVDSIENLPEEIQNNVKIKEIDNDDYKRVPLIHHLKVINLNNGEENDFYIVGVSEDQDKICLDNNIEPDMWLERILGAKAEVLCEKVAENAYIAHMGKIVLSFEDRISIQGFIKSIEVVNMPQEKYDKFQIILGLDPIISDIDITGHKGIENVYTESKHLYKIVINSGEVESVFTNLSINSFVSLDIHKNNSLPLNLKIQKICVKNTRIRKMEHSGGNFIFTLTDASWTTYDGTEHIDKEIKISVKDTDIHYAELSGIMANEKYSYYVDVYLDYGEVEIRGRQNCSKIVKAKIDIIY